MSDELTNKVRAQDGFRQITESERSVVERKKEALKIQCEKEAIQILRNLKCDSPKLSKPTEVNVTCEDRFLNGDIKVHCSAFKNKPFEIDVIALIKDDSLTFPTLDNLMKELPADVEKRPSILESVAEIKPGSVKIEAELEIMEKEKESFIIAAEAKVVNLLRGLKYDSIKLYQNSEVKLQRNSDKGYDGQISVFVRLTDKDGTKKVKIPILFSNSSFNFPSVNILEKEIAKTSTESEITEKELDEQTEEKIEDIEEEEKVKEEETLSALEIGPAASKVEDITKQAGATLPCVNLARTLRVNKSVLPDSIKPKDIIDVDGVKYQITDDTYTKLSEAGTSSVWLLTKVENISEEVQFNLGS